MSRVLTFSRTYPSYHPKAGQPTYFIEKIWKSLLDKNAPLEPYWMNGEWLKNDDNTKSIPWDYEPKNHTIRAGHRWKEGDWFSPRVWSGKPYASKMIQFAPDIQVKKVWSLKRDDYGIFEIAGKDIYDSELARLAQNDGLTTDDLWYWIKWPCECQIICWNENIEY